MCPDSDVSRLVMCPDSDMSRLVMCPEYLVCPHIITLDSSGKAGVSMNVCIVLCGVYIGLIWLLRDSWC